MMIIEKIKVDSPNQAIKNPIIFPDLSATLNP